MERGVKNDTRVALISEQVLLVLSNPNLRKSFLFLYEFYLSAMLYSC